MAGRCRGAGHSRVALYGRPRALRASSPRAIGHRPVACDTPEAAFAIPRMCSYAVESVRRLLSCPLLHTLCTDPCLGLASSFSISPIPQILVRPMVIISVLPCVPVRLSVVVDRFQEHKATRVPPSIPWVADHISVWREILAQARISSHQDYPLYHHPLKKSHLNLYHPCPSPGKPLMLKAGQILGFHL